MCVYVCVCVCVRVCVCMHAALQRLNCMHVCCAGANAACKVVLESNLSLTLPCPLVVCLVCVVLMLTLLLKLRVQQTQGRFKCTLIHTDIHTHTDSLTHTHTHTHTHAGDSIPQPCCRGTTRGAPARAGRLVLSQVGLPERAARCVCVRVFAVVCVHVCV